MSKRLEGKVAVIVGAGQSPGEGVGNGRATAMLFAREGAKVLCVDFTLAAANETVEIIRAEGGEAAAFEADVAKESMLKAAIDDTIARCTQRRNRARQARVSSTIFIPG